MEKMKRREKIGDHPLETILKGIDTLGRCIFCGELGGEEHIALCHGSVFSALTELGPDAAGLTQQQFDAILCFARNMPDWQIAQHLDIKESTVRYQRFNLKNNARQARIFLALMELTFRKPAASAPPARRLVKLPQNYTEECFQASEIDIERALACFEGDTFRLWNYPRIDRRRVVILRHIATRFEQGRDYTEREINDILRESYNDVEMLRREMIMIQLLERERDGSRYRLAPGVGPEGSDFPCSESL